jgi:proline iminopeptidase
VRIETEGAGETVVIAGGGPGVGHAHYHPWFSALADRFLVAYLEYEGTTIEGYGEQIEAVRQQLGAERVAVIALSFGGMPALAFALRHPERLWALVLSNAQVSAATWQRGNIDAVNAALRAHYPERWARLLELRERGVRSLDDEIQEMYGELLERMEWADPARRPALRQGAPPDMAVYAAVAGDDPEWEVGGTMAAFDPDLSRVAAPTRVVSGRWDGLTTPQLAHETAAALPRAELAVLERSGHRPWCEEPERYFEIVGDFLSAARPAR